MSDDAIQPPPKPHRALAIALALIAIACLGFAEFSPRWLATATGNPELGLRASRECRMSSLEGGANGSEQLICDRDSNSTLVDDIAATGSQNASKIFPILGWVLTVLIALGALGLVTATVLAIAGKRPDLAIAPTTIGLLCSLIGLVCGCIFVATKPYEGGYLGVQMGFWVFGVGSVCALTASQLLATGIRPVDQDLNAESMSEDQF